MPAAPDQNPPAEALAFDGNAPAPAPRVSFTRMFRTTALLGAAALTVAAVHQFASGASAPASDVAWMNDLEDATATALRTGRPMLVVFR
jgi:hypothetical protein